VHEDRDVWVVDKPAGLVVHPGAGNPRHTLQNALLGRDPALAALPRAGIIHRLDKDTSGLLVIARTPEAQTSLSRQLLARTVSREYLAVCGGVMTGGGTIDEPIGRHRTDRLRMTVREDGRPAITHYRVLERFRAHTYLRVKLETGRTRSDCIWHTGSIRSSGIPCMEAASRARAAQGISSSRRCAPFSGKRCMPPPWRSIIRAPASG
jgi:23S rRNA pseudouridine1911/1915/1917 synthase